MQGRRVPLSWPSRGVHGARAGPPDCGPRLPSSPSGRFSSWSAPPTVARGEHVGRSRFPSPRGPRSRMRTADEERRARGRSRRRIGNSACGPTCLPSGRSPAEARGRTDRPADEQARDGRHEWPRARRDRGGVRDADGVSAPKPGPRRARSRRTSAIGRPPGGGFSERKGGPLPAPGAGRKKMRGPARRRRARWKRTARRYPGRPVDPVGEPAREPLEHEAPGLDGEQQDGACPPASPAATP